MLAAGCFPLEVGVSSIRPWARSWLLVLAMVSAAAVFGLPASTADADAGAVTHGPLERLVNGSSTNWAGYVATSGPFTSISASWVQPVGICVPTKTTYSAFWVGLDGDGSKTVEQNGSEVDCIDGVPTYYAWYETYPANAVDYSDTVDPGDLFEGSVTATAAGAFTLTLTDETEGWTQVQQETLTTAKRASAEVIAEAPSDASGVLPLTDFGEVKFSKVQADGTRIGKSSPKKITMESATTVKAKPGALINWNSFAVNWKHY
jgi:peptidase A4-like protein